LDLRRYRFQHGLSTALEPFLTCLRQQLTDHHHSSRI